MDRRCLKALARAHTFAQRTRRTEDGLASLKRLFQSVFVFKKKKKEEKKKKKTTQVCTDRAFFMTEAFVRGFSFLEPF